MSWLSLVTGLFRPAKELIEVFKPNAEQTAERDHVETMALSQEDLASLQQFTAEFHDRAGRTWWDFADRWPEPSAAADDHARHPRPVRAGAGRAGPIPRDRPGLPDDAGRLLGAAQRHHRLLFRRPHAAQGPGHGGQGGCAPDGTRDPGHPARRTAARSAGARARIPARISAGGPVSADAARRLAPARPDPRRRPPGRASIWWSRSGATVRPPAAGLSSRPPASALGPASNIPSRSPSRCSPSPARGLACALQGAYKVA